MGLRDTFEKEYIPKVLMQDPGTFKMLEQIYLKQAGGPIDQYFIKSLSGQALRQRLDAVINYGVSYLTKIIPLQKEVRIVNYGSGTARDTIGIMTTLRENRIPIDKVIVDCIDINEEALTKASSLIEAAGLAANFNLIQDSLLGVKYKKAVDLGLMVGILCGLPFKDCVAILSKVKKHLRGILIASNVLTTMVDRDLVMAYFLRDIIGWLLVYKSPAELQKIFEAAGYKWLDCFFDLPLKFHAMGVGTPL